MSPPAYAASTPCNRPLTSGLSDRHPLPRPASPPAPPLSGRLRSAPSLSAFALLLALLPLGGCFEVSSSPPSPDPADAPAAYEAERALCVSITNAYRTSAGRPALARAERLETYATAAARHDGMLRQAHQYVHATNFGDGLVRAENELLWWPLSTYGSVRKVVEAGLAQMWNEGPGGSHRRNILGDYTEVGCGVFVNNGAVTLAQAFR